MRPDEKVWAQWVFHLCRMEKANDYIEKRSDWWVEQLMNAGISATVFKGTSVAAWYRNPLHRCYGDIDIVVTEGWHELMLFCKIATLFHVSGKVTKSYYWIRTICMLNFTVIGNSCITR